MYGDADDGYVWTWAGAWGPSAAAVRGALLLERGDLAASAERFAEPARWLLGREASPRFEALAAPSERALASRAFPDTGYYLLQCGSAEAWTGSASSWTAASSAWARSRPTATRTR